MNMSNLDEIIQAKVSILDIVYEADQRLYLVDIAKTKEDIKKLFIDLIGDNENPSGSRAIGVPSYQRDLLRNELRLKIEKL